VWGGGQLGGPCEGAPPPQTPSTQSWKLGAGRPASPSPPYSRRCPCCRCHLLLLLLLQFKKLAELETVEAGSIVDVIGVLDSVEPWAVITRKDGTDTRKRSATIRDDSGRSVEVRGV
jgi:hypothetical protein